MTCLEDLIFKIMKEYLIIYHKEDNDGVVSAALFVDHIIYNLGKKREDIGLLPADYNTLNKMDKKYLDNLISGHKNIIITDISFNDHNMMVYLYKKMGSNLIWIDHHWPVIKDSIAKKYDDIRGLRDIKNSALFNTYCFLYSPFGELDDVKIPEIYKILSAYDSWSYEILGYTLQYARNVNTGFTFEYNLDIEQWIESVHYINSIGGTFKEHELIANMNTYGMTINNYEAKKNTMLMNSSADKGWVVNDRPAVALFSCGASNSQIFASLQNTVYKNGIVFKREQGKTWSVSLYNINEDPEFHCGNYLQDTYGGGGHQGAGGATLSDETFMNLLKTKRM